MIRKERVWCVGDFAQKVGVPVVRGADDVKADTEPEA